MVEVFLFLKNYVVTFIYAIGLIYFIYGFIEYFLIGRHGDEERMQNGREILVKSCAWFLLGLIIFGIIVGAEWVSDNLTAPTDGVQLEHERDSSYLKVPNVPGR